MLRQSKFTFAIFCVVVVVAATQWIGVIGAATGETTPREKTTPSPAVHQVEENNSSDINNHNDNSNNNNNNIKTSHKLQDNKIDDDLFYSDEFPSSEYDDGHGMDGDLHTHRQHQQVQDHEWDVLIFTQQWPVTTCYHWREEDRTHDCTFAAKKELWTVHGVWPTKLGQFGPNFCNKTTKFDVNQLDPIMEDMKMFWPQIEADTEVDSLWEHEWVKHGSCAVQLDKLNNELKYFKQGLNWRSLYFLTDILGDSGIAPDTNNTVVAIQAALIRGLGKNPSIHCLYSEKHDISYLLEIRICFDKSLQLIDCDGVKMGDAVSIDYPGGTLITNCHISKPVYYPTVLPPLLRKKHKKWVFPVVNTYKLLQFIMWFTL